MPALISRSGARQWRADLQSPWKRAAASSTQRSKDGKTARATISVGVGLFPAHGGELKALVARADRALYRAKEDGRNRVCLDVT